MSDTSHFNLQIAGFSGKLAVLSFELLEGTGGSDCLSVSFAVNSSSLSGSLAGCEANFSFEYNGQKEFFNGMATEYSAEQSGTLSRVTLNIKTLRHLLDKEKKYAVFCESDAESIIRSILQKAGVSAVKYDLSKFYEVDFKIQYNESDLEFLQRLMEDFNIIEFVKHYDGRSELVISGNNIFTPSVVYLTKSRLQIIDKGNFFFGYGHKPIRPGTAIYAFNEKFIVCSVFHKGSQEAAFGLKDKTDGYTCQIAAFSERMLGSVPRSKEKPKIPGVIVAKTQGFVGSFASIDSEGRYIVRMPFDGENYDMATSVPVHLAQNFAGRNCGVHFPLRKDTPILIAFENGNIDKPIALGAIPRDGFEGPVIGANSFQNILKTHSGIKFTFNDLTSCFDAEAPKDISAKAGNELTLIGEKQSILKTKEGIKLCMNEVKGSLDMEASKNVSIKAGAAKQANAGNAKAQKNAKGNLKMEAPESISMRTGKTRLGLGDSKTSINMGAKKNISIKASEKLLLNGKNLVIEAPANITIKAGGRLILKGKTVEIN
jgi:hypothetical protein